MQATVKVFQGQFKYSTYLIYISIRKLNCTFLWTKANSFLNIHEYNINLMFIIYVIINIIDLLVYYDYTKNVLSKFHID